MAKIEKTNVARLLDKTDIKYELVTYVVDPENLSAIHVAEELGEDISTVFKTIVLHGDRNGYFVAVVPGDKEIDLKKAAKANGDKKAELIAMKDLLPLTGYIRGGCCPIGMKKKFPTYFHESSRDLPFIYVSAGVRGMQLKIKPEDIISYTNATVCDLIIQENEQ